MLNFLNLAIEAKFIIYLNIFKQPISLLARYIYINYFPIHFIIQLIKRVTLSWNYRMSKAN